MDHFIPRRLRWDIPPNDGLTDKESIDEWGNLFNTKGSEALEVWNKVKAETI